MAQVVENVDSSSYRVEMKNLETEIDEHCPTMSCI
jgi:hypothetical protein